MSLRRTSALVLAVGGIVFIAITVAFVPWDPVAGGPLKAPDAEDFFTATEIARGEGFARWARVWSWSSLAASLCVGSLLGFTRLGSSMVDRLPGPWWAQVPVAVATLALIGRVLTLPFALALHEHMVGYDLSHQAWSGFAVDLARSEAVDIIATSLAMLVLLGAARRWQQAWPAVAGGILAISVAVGSLLYPVLVEPLFNSFASLPDGPLRTQILEMADRENVDIDDVLVADASRRTTTLNAYVSGLGGTRRVVVYDNLVDDVGERQTLSVVAHELAHAKNQDVAIGTSLGAAGALIGVGMLGLLLSRRRDQEGLASPRSVPVVLALVAVASVLVSPVENGISRRIETRADVEAMRATGDLAAFISLQQELARRSAADLTPPAWSQFWFGSHPTTLVRISSADRVTTSK